MGRVDYENDADRFGRLRSSKLHLQTPDRDIRAPDCDVVLNPENPAPDDCRITYTPTPAKLYTGSTNMPSWTYEVDYDAQELVTFWVSGFNPQPDVDYNPFPSDSARFFETPMSAVSPPALPFVFDGENFFGSTNCRLLRVTGASGGTTGGAYIEHTGSDPSSLDGWTAVEEDYSLAANLGWNYGTAGGGSTDRRFGSSLSFSHSIKYRTEWSTGSGNIDNMFVFSSIFTYKDADVTEATWKATENYSGTLVQQSATHTMAHYKNVLGGAGESWTFLTTYTFSHTHNDPASFPVYRS